MNRRSFLKFFGTSAAAAAVPAVVIDKQEEEKLNAHTFLEMCEPEANLKNYLEEVQQYPEAISAATYRLGIRDTLWAVHNHFNGCKCTDDWRDSCDPEMHKATAQVLKLMRKRGEKGEI